MFVEPRSALACVKELPEEFGITAQDVATIFTQMKAAFKENSVTNLCATVVTHMINKSNQNSVAALYKMVTAQKDVAPRKPGKGVKEEKKPTKPAMIRGASFNVRRKMTMNLATMPGFNALGAKDVA